MLKYALGYILSIKVEFVMRNMMSVCLICYIWKGSRSKKYNFQKIEKKLLIFNVISFESANI